MRTDYIKPQSYARLFFRMQYPNVLALRLSLETGLRIDDVLSLRPEQLSGTKLSYVAKKTGKPGKKNVSTTLAKEIRRQAGKDWLFPGRSPGKHRTRQAVWRDVKQAARALGLSENVAPHSARKTYAVQLRKEEGVAAVQKELQHSHGDTTMLYAFADMVTKTGTVPGTISQDPEILAELIAEKVVEKLWKRWGKP